MAILEDVMRNVCYLLHGNAKSAIADITDVVQNISVATPHDQGIYDMQEAMHTVTAHVKQQHHSVCSNILLAGADNV